MSELKDEPDSVSTESLTKTRVKLSVLFLLSAAPFLLAYVFFFAKPGWIPSGMTNQGELLLPPVQASEVGIAHETLFGGERWLMVIPVGSSCNQECIDALYYSRQVKTALGKESGRIERVVLSESAEISTSFEQLLLDEHKNAKLVYNSSKSIGSLIEPVLGRKPAESFILLMDPNGNIMMFYTLDKAGKPMLKDIKHLLKASNIG